MAVVFMLGIDMGVRYLKENSRPEILVRVPPVYSHAA